MKKIIILVGLVLLLCFPGISFAWYSDWYWNETTCGICEKSIYYYVEASFGPYMPSTTMDSSSWLDSDKERSEQFTIISPRICNQCLDKYGEKLQGIVADFIESAQIESADLIEKHKEERRQRKVKSHHEEIKLLKQQLLELEENENADHSDRTSPPK